MAHIKLFVPDSTMPEEYDVQRYKVEGGVLTFHIQPDSSLPTATKITTTVPFLVREEVSGASLTKL